MSFVVDTGKGIVNAVPVIIAKIGTVLLFIFSMGLITGYMIAFYHISPLFLFIPFVAMIVMWKKLDEGVLALIILIILAAFFSDMLPIL